MEAKHHRRQSDRILRIPGHPAASRPTAPNLTATASCPDPSESSTADDRSGLTMLTPRRRRFLIWCAVAFSVAGIYLQVFGVATWFVVVKGRNLAGKDPALWKT